MLLADADFQPSPELATKVLPLIRSKTKKFLKSAVVVPAFEYADVPHKSDVVAANKHELMQLIHAQVSLMLNVNALHELISDS